jgi:hypothetical protein
MCCRPIGNCRDVARIANTQARLALEYIAQAARAVELEHAPRRFALLI